MAGAVQAGQQGSITDPMNLPPAGRMVPRLLLALQQRKKALTVLLTQALIFAHLLHCSLDLSYVFVFPLQRDQQRLLFG